MAKLYGGRSIKKTCLGQDVINRNGGINMYYVPRYGTASTGNDRGNKRRGFMLKSVITHRRTTHEGLKVPPNAPDGLVVS